jgi:F-type H+-transporting ATPase subunit b
MGGLGIEWPVLVTQLVSFTLLFIILRFVAYKPILKMLDERSKRVKESLEQAELVKAQSQRSEDEVKKQIQAASQQGQEIIAKATQTSEAIRAGAQDLAKKDAELLIENARQAIKAERESAVDELRQEFADLTVLAAGKVIGQTLDKKSHKELIDKVLQESRRSNKG